MSTNISNEYFTHQYMDDVEGYIVNNIDSENTILVSKTPILIGQCRFRVRLFMKNKILIKVTLVAVTVQEYQTYTDIPTREVHEKWAKNNFGEPDFVEVFGYRYMLPDAEIITEHDPRSGSDIISIKYNNNSKQYSEYAGAELTKVSEIYKRICNNILSGKKVPHSTSQPVIYKEGEKFYLAVFVFFYSRDDIETGEVSRPTMWAIADIETGEIIEERQTSSNEFSDASYEVKYNIRSDKKYDTSKEYYNNAFSILDSCRKRVIENGDLDRDEYSKYLQLIVANIPEEYQRFYYNLSISLEEG